MTRAVGGRHGAHQLEVRFGGTEAGATVAAGNAAIMLILA